MPFSQTGGVADVDQARQQLASLEIAPEHDAGYDRDDWPHWQHADKLDPGKGCAVPGGTWTSSYDGEVVTDPSDLDIDHLVPLAEAHASGGHDWNEDQRATYANDTRYLLPVSASSNRSKGDQDPAEWLPDLDVCGDVALYVEAKAEYHLSVDHAERDSIDRELERC